MYLSKWLKNIPTMPCGRECGASGALLFAGENAKLSSHSGNRGAVSYKSEHTLSK